jgi:hypothetical protein
MTPEEIQYEIDNSVERVVNSNAEMKDYLAVVARGVWQIALQQARANELTVLAARREQI